eukprot:gene19986-26700_t
MVDAGDPISEIMGSVLEVTIRGQPLRLPSLWLRDVSEWHRHTYQRAVSMVAVPTDISVVQHEVDETKNALRVTWSSPEGTGLPPAAEFDQATCPLVTSLSQLAAPPPHAHHLIGAATSWSPTGQLITEYDLKWLLAHAPGIYTSDQAFAEAHLPLPRKQYGFGLVTGVPATDGDTEALCRRVTWPRPTMYSGDMWKTEVRPVEKSQDTAYGSDALPSHTDGNYFEAAPGNYFEAASGNYFEAAPGVQVFHATVAAKDGGGSILVDGFAVAQLLKTEQPAAHDWLLSNKTPYHYLDGATYSDFHYNALDRAAFAAPPGVGNPVAWLADAYAAVRALECAMASPELELHFTLQPGTVLAFDNRRLLHGRDAFDPTSGRTLVGCYMDKEEWLSRYRVTAAACPSRQ